MSQLAQTALRLLEMNVAEAAAGDVTEARAAQQRVAGHAAVFKHEVAGAAAPDAHLVFFLAQAQSWCWVWNNER